ncbi:MAG TPA: hypothetical protein DD670_20460, partial [Planctomycetaceae bacterium]|nr:hypothetical protein [Planctomycetaceae bacterium]
RIDLHDVEDYHGRLVDADGKPIVGATIRPMLWVGDASPESGIESFMLSAEVIRRATANTTDDGRFVLKGLPQNGRTTVRLTTEGFGSPYVDFVMTKPVTIQLDKPGSVRGTIDADGQAVTDEIRLSLHNAQIARSVAELEVIISHHDQTKTGADGAFRFEAVPPGKYQVAPQLPEELPYYVDQETPIEVKPGEEAAATITLKKAIEIKGKVADQTTGKGLKGVRLYFQTPYTPGGTHWGRTTTTNEAGEFTVHAKPGKLTSYLAEAPEGYLLSDRSQQSKTIDVTGPMPWPTIELSQAASVEGIVVDDAGEPVADAEIWYLTGDGMHSHGHVKSDASGKFLLKQGSPNSPISLRVKATTATSDGPVNVTPAELKEPVKITVSEKHGSRMTGKLVDKQGKPIGGAGVGLQTSWMLAGSGIGFQMTSTTTDADGNFAFEGLWPGDSYQLMIEAAGYAKYQSANVTAKPARAHDFGQIVLAGTQSVVEGAVVDSAGKPLAGVRVFNSGDAPEPLFTKTDEAGRFRLKGFPSGKVHVFAHHADYRFTALRTETDAEPVTLVMLHADEPVPQQSQPAEPTLDQRKQAVRKTIERLWKARGAKEMQGLIRVMAQIDPEAALAWSKEVGGRYDRTVYSTLAENLAATDIEEALDLLDRRNYYAIKELGQKLVDTCPEAAMRCAEEMVPLARAMDQPQRAVALADVGGLIVRLGNRPAGSKLIEEAAAMVESMGSGKSRQEAAQQVAVRLALVDPDRAVEMLKSAVNLEEKPYYLRNVAVQAATHELAKAKAMMKEMQPWYAEDVVTPIAYRIARSDPDEALAFVRESGVGDGRQDFTNAKTQALGWIAVAMADKDRKKARALIDEALDLCAAPEDASRGSGSRDRRAIVAAFLAVQARRIGHPDMESVVWRVLASRATTKDTWSPASAAERNVAAALILALVDPAAAREMLEPYEDKGDEFGGGGTGIGSRELFKASFLADAATLDQRIDRELESAARNKRRWEQLCWPMTEALEIMVLPEDQQLTKAFEYMSGGVWMPSRDQ